MTKFVDILREFQVPFRESGHEHCRPGWIQIDCPFCSRGSSHFRMGYNTRGNYVNCWACGRHQLAQTLQEMIDRPMNVCYRLLRGIEVDHKGPEKKPRGKLVLPKGVGPLLPAHRKYLRDRGYDPEYLTKVWEVKGIGLSSELAWRVFIPIIYGGSIVSWTTRTIDKSGPRYYAAKAEQEALDHRELLYGEDYARHTVIVCEGPFDVWRIGPGAVCTCGTMFSRAQVNRISEYYTRVICFDSLPDAQAKAKELCDLLEPLPGNTYNVVLETGKDAGDADEDEIVQLRRRFLYDQTD